MASQESNSIRAGWDLLDIYRERYDIEDRVSDLLHLRRTHQRRQNKSDALFRRAADLEKQLNETQSQLDAVRAEIAGTSTAVGLALEETIGSIRRDYGEAWSPTPVLGFRMWVIRDNGLYGAKTKWRIPKLRSICLNSVPGQDVPHSTTRCGPPACGVYATKELATLRKELGVGDIDGYVLGVVALSGKVVEHESGYRGAVAQAIDVAGRWNGHHIMTSDTGDISNAFGDPDETFKDLGESNSLVKGAIDSYLTTRKEERDQWIWEEKSASSK
jgi:hypothetical protein